MDKAPYKDWEINSKFKSVCGICENSIPPKTLIKGYVTLKTDLKPKYVHKECFANSFKPKVKKKRKPISAKRRSRQAKAAAKTRAKNKASGKTGSNEKKYQYNYNRYMKSTAWKKRRLSFLDSNPSCYACHSKEKLNVHHIRYQTPFDGKEPDGNLLSLCEPCHNELHSNPGSAEDATIAFLGKLPTEKKRGYNRPHGS